MFKQLRLPRSVAVPALKRAGPIAAALTAALVLVPSAASGTYTDATGDSAAAGDIHGVTVMGDKQSGQVVFRISGTNLGTAEENMLFLAIDSDSNPLTGDLTDHGTDYWFGMGGGTYWFEHWDGSRWVQAPYATVRVTGNTSQIMVSVNRSELGNASAFNFVASTFAFSLGNVAVLGTDSAPNDGAFNYSFDANGPRIDSVDVRTTPSAGPKAGKRFVVTPTGLKLPPDGRATASPSTPESYTCAAKLGTRRLAGTGTGGCTFAIPKKKAHGKRLTVVLTVNYQGATKSVPLTFRVA